jgi:hypothetical protein
MNYTKYLLGMINSNGVPRMDERSSTVIFKIIYLEGRVNGLASASKKMHNTKTPHKFDLDVFDMSRKLTELTGNRDPKEVFVELLKQG